MPFFLVLNLLQLLGIVLAVFVQGSFLALKFLHLEGILIIGKFCLFLDSLCVTDTACAVKHGLVPLLVGEYQLDRKSVV